MKLLLIVILFSGLISANTQVTNMGEAGDEPSANTYGTRVEAPPTLGSFTPYSNSGDTGSLNQDYLGSDLTAALQASGGQPKPDDNPGYGDAIKYPSLIQEETQDYWYGPYYKKTPGIQAQQATPAENKAIPQKR